MAKVSITNKKLAEEQKQALRSAINDDPKFKAAILREHDEREALWNLVQQHVQDGARVAVYNGRRGTRVSISFTPLVIPEPTTPEISTDE